ncbi:short-chain dehydrogenase/reductase SDR [Chlorobaculum parvum NCIB 8327]|uniref:Short-chain dehydrogenase/reductase SDR n=1 Tax=Chlorobaculum parvum (strain DSM 263 / NCIMB 8327) TaxID=517417 RepID=B3QPJ9_CHLP8|nr:SDR family oxidoreductase [Chlorobaculum parvum]ACF11852.1 short-chain dehydrogenase/reductase SDR [Chlorobaculum parvum NCIB 8327]
MKIKKILVTGGTGGIGSSIVACLSAQPGFVVHAPSRSELDLGLQESIKEYFSRSSDYDIVINNAGINTPQNIEQIETEQIETALNINLVAPLLVIKYCVPHMKRQGFGRIVNVSSIWGIRSKERRTLYSATKFGLNGMTRSLARELGPFNILVNSICPGYVDTALTRKNVTPKEQEKIRQEIPLRRFAEPREIAESIAFLVSERNSYMTGQTLIVDGGFIA